MIKPTLNDEDTDQLEKDAQIYGYGLYCSLVLGITGIILLVGLPLIAWLIFWIIGSPRIDQHQMRENVIMAFVYAAFFITVCTIYSVVCGMQLSRISKRQGAEPKTVDSN